VGIHDKITIDGKTIDLTNMDQEGLELFLNYFLFVLRIPPGFSKSLVLDNVELLEDNALYEIMQKCIGSSVAKNHKESLLNLFKEVFVLKKIANKRKFLKLYLEILQS
jgi:hypothetical protein